MTHLDNLVADSLAQSPDTVVHQLATDRERLRGELEAARAEIADLKRCGVVEIELSEDDWIEASDEMLDPLSDRRCSHNWRDTFPEGITVKHAREKCVSDKIRFFRRRRTIPADRELMRLVDELIRWHGLRPLDKRPDHAAVLVGAIKALRAQPTQELAP